jgi:hypothetical protein
MRILVSFKGSRSDVENLTSLLAQLATLNRPRSPRRPRLDSDTSGFSQVAEALATLLEPGQLGALRSSPAMSSPSF